MRDMLDNNFIDPSALSRALIRTNSVPSTRSESDIIQYIIDNNIQIYWPYSENWDGQTLPTITFTPEDKNQIWNWGYVRNENERGGISYDKIYVDEQYAENNPVWVIDKRDMSDVLTSPCIQTRSSEFHPWILKEIQVKHQYDSWLQGASNFKITIGFPKMEGYAGGANMISFKVTRKQIRKEKWVKLNRILNDDWSEDQLSNSMFMVETDGGKTVTATIGSSYKANNNLTINASTTVSYKNNDDIVHQWEYKRSVMVTSTMDKIWLSSDGYVNFKMIIE